MLRTPWPGSPSMLKQQQSSTPPASHAGSPLLLVASPPLVAEVVGSLEVVGLGGSPVDIIASTVDAAASCCVLAAIPSLVPSSAAEQARASDRTRDTAGCRRIAIRGRAWFDCNHAADTGRGHTVQSANDGRARAGPQDHRRRPKRRPGPWPPACSLGSQARTWQHRPSRRRGQRWPTPPSLLKTG